MQKKKLNLQSKISETLLIPLYARAREQHQKPSLLIDHSAQHLVDSIDYNFEKFELSPISMTGVVIRASYFDAIVSQFIQQHSEPIVVHLGCGLDTRQQRLGQRAEKAHFYHIDVADVIALRKELLPAQDNETSIASSMFDQCWMDDLAQKHPSATFIFIIEGVLMYFEPLHNRQLFERLAQRFSGAEIHFDVISRWLSSHTYLHDAVRFTSAKFKFGLDDDKLIASWHPCLQYQASFDLLGFDGWQRTGVPYVMGQAFFPSFKSMTRVVAYLIK